MIAGLPVFPEPLSNEIHFEELEINCQLWARGFPIVSKEEDQSQFSVSRYSAISRPCKPVMAYEEIRECLKTCKSKHFLCRKESSQPMPLLLVDCRDRSLKHGLSSEET